MKRLIPLFLLSCAPVGELLADAGEPTCDAGEARPDAGEPAPDAGEPTPDAGPLRVLFIGNSYTYVNDLPSVLASLGTPMQVETVAVGGARLVDHWGFTGARTRLQDGGFDVVVIQAQSLEPILWTEDFYYYADLFGDAARAAGTRPIWFATWARRAGDPVYSDPTFGARTPAEMTEQLEARYFFAEKLAGGDVSRVGASWQQFGDELYAADGSHPSAEGTMLSACVLYVTLTGNVAKVPDPAPLGLTGERAHALCDWASSGVCLYSTGRPCDGKCVDLDFDAENCGTCGTRCAQGQTCQVGHCQ